MNHQQFDNNQMSHSMIIGVFNAIIVPLFVSDTFSKIFVAVLIALASGYFYQVGRRLHERLSGKRGG